MMMTKPVVVAFHKSHSEDTRCSKSHLHHTHHIPTGLDWHHSHASHESFTYIHIDIITNSLKSPRKRSSTIVDLVSCSNKPTHCWSKGFQIHIISPQSERSERGAFYFCPGVPSGFCCVCVCVIGYCCVWERGCCN